LRDIEATPILPTARGRLARNRHPEKLRGGSMEQQDATQRVRRLEPSQDVVGQRLGDEVVLVSLQTNRIFELNRTGARFWELLQSESDRGRIEQRLLEEFEVSEEDLSAEVDQLIKNLTDEELIRVLDHD
jgi:hypothetical protein